MNPWVRRLAYAPREPVRLWLRERRGDDAAARVGRSDRGARASGATGSSIDVEMLAEDRARARRPGQRVRSDRRPHGPREGA